MTANGSQVGCNHKETKLEIDQKEFSRLLQETRTEILDLRRQNEILGAKVEMIELFADVLFTEPRKTGRGYGEDVAWKLQQAIDSLEIES